MQDPGVLPKEPANAVHHNNAAKYVQFDRASMSALPDILLDCMKLILKKQETQKTFVRRFPIVRNFVDI